MESLAYIYMALAYEEMQYENSHSSELDAEKRQIAYQYPEPKSTCSRNKSQAFSIRKPVKA